MHCVSPLTPTPVHCNDCLKLHAIPPGASGVSSHFRNFDQTCLLRAIEVGFRGHDDIAEGEDLLDLRKATCIGNYCESELGRVLEGVQSDRRLPSFRAGRRSLSDAGRLGRSEEVADNWRISKQLKQLRSWWFRCLRGDLRVDPQQVFSSPVGMAKSVPGGGRQTSNVSG
jgi:hypothetical protein